MSGAHATAHRRSEPTISTQEILSFVTAYGTRPPGRVDVPQFRWPSLLEALTRRNLTGLSVAAVRAGDLLITGQQEEELFARHRSAMMHVLELERTLLSLGRTFEMDGVRYTVLKGPALARTMYPDASWRPFSDLDLLVGGDDWPRAQELLAVAGFRRQLPEPRPGFDRRFGKAATHRNAEGLEVDLHRTLVLGPVGLWIDPAEMASAAAGFELGGRRFERLDDTGLLLNAASTRLSDGRRHFRSRSETSVRSSPRGASTGTVSTDGSTGGISGRSYDPRSPPRPRPSDGPCTNGRGSTRRSNRHHPRNRCCGRTRRIGGAPPRSRSAHSGRSPVSVEGRLRERAPPARPSVPDGARWAIPPSMEGSLGVVPSGQVMARCAG